MNLRMKPTVVSLFSSGGVGDFGLKKAGFETIATAELLPRRLEIQRLNGIASVGGYFCGDLNNEGLLDRIVERAQTHVERTREPVSLLVATPPCQGMSVANHKKNDELARNSLVVRSIEAVERIEPLVFIFENVPAFLRTVCTGLDGVDRSIGGEIERVLGGKYEFYSRTLPLQEYGSPSSRKRSITVGIRNDILWATPLDVFPDAAPAPTLRELIGDLPSLKEPGDFDPSDIYHAYRPFDPRMLPWIQATPEGASAFDNKQDEYRPHRIIDGVRVENVRKNGDKYRRVFWDAVAPCVHTRNDILASQSTVHPSDHRVFSIRELMRMMGLPKEFKWISDFEIEAASSDDDIRKLLKTHAPNIRQCLGEAVPATVMENMGRKIIRHVLSPMVLRGGVPKINADAALTSSLQRSSYLKVEDGRKRTNAAFYTQPLPAFAVAKRAWENLKGSKKPIFILEPSVGSGVFATLIAQLIERETVHFVATDIDAKALEHVEQIPEDLKSKFASFTCFHQNYLDFSHPREFDLVIGNPPFGRGPKSTDPRWGNSLEIADQFFRKAITEARIVAFVFPKALLHAQGYRELRYAILGSAVLDSIVDFGEVAFPDVKVETVGLVVTAGNPSRNTKIKSWPLSLVKEVAQDYIADDRFPSWVIYRNAEFDQVLEKSEPGRFKVWRDRSVTKRKSVEEGQIRVLRGKNIHSSGEIRSTPEDYFVSEDMVKPVLKKLNAMSESPMLLVPNLSYYPRAAKYCPNSRAFPEGSCAVLYGDVSESEVNRVVRFASTQTFTKFYRVACNFATRSINVDSCLVFWWIVPEKT